MQQTHLTREQLAAYRDGRLDEAAEIDVESHLADCQQCCEQLDSLPDSIVDLFHAPASGEEDDDGYVMMSGDENDAYEDDWSVEAADELVIDADSAAQGNVDDTAVDRRVSGGMLAALANHPRYRILELLGRGGMGDVYKAEHRLMQRTVALKVIRRNLVRHPQAVERFRREVQAAARLDHPNIVTAYDAEQVGDWHFLLMEYVDGRTLAEEVAARGPLPIREACEHARQVALALQHAHEQGMVHRDIKPHNLMVENTSPPREQGGSAAEPSLARRACGTIKILDFGLASLAEVVDLATEPDDTHNDATDSQLTRTGSMMGTPDYVAPEQARDARAADIRADIYSLGCTLYFLLTGRPPNAELTRRASDGQTSDSIPRLRVGLPEERADELEAILARMLAEQLEARFQTPAEVAEALSPLTVDPPIESEPKHVAALVRVRDDAPDRVSANAGTSPSATEPEADWSARYALGCMAIVGLALVGLCGLMVYGIVSLFDDSHVADATGDGQTATDRQPAPLDPPTKAKPANQRPAGDGPTINTEPLRRLTGHTAVVRGLDISPDGKRLISASWDGSGRLWDLQTGEMLHLFHHEPRVNDAKFSLGSRKIIFAENTTVRVYDAETYQRLPLKFEHPKPLTKLEFSDDHRQMLTGCLDGQMRLWGTQTGQLLKTYGGHKKSLEAVLFTAGGKQVLSGSLDTTVRRFNTESGRLQAWYPHPGMVLSMCSSPAGRVVYVGCARGVIMAWDFETGQIIKQFRGHQGEVLRLATHGRMLVSAGSDRTARVWDVATGRELIRMVDHQDRIDALAISPNGRLIVTGGGFHPVSKATWERPDYVIRVWQIEPLTINGLPAKASDKGKNLVTDPSLENSPVGKAFPPGWGNFNADPEDGYRFELVEGGRSGKHGWLIEGKGTYITVPTNRVSIIRGKRYVGKGWVKLSGSGSAQIRLLYFDRNRTYIGETRFSRATASDQWQQVSIIDRIADFPETHFVALAMSVIGDGKAIFDDLELRAVAPESLEQQ